MKLLRFLRKKDENPVCSAVIVAAGSSQRMGCDKLSMALGGMPVLARTLKAFEESPFVEEIVVVTRADRLTEVADLCRQYSFDKVTKVLIGGATRAESSLAGVSNVSSKARLIAIHDAARPFVSQELIERTVRAAKAHLSAVPALRCVDTLKAADEQGFVVGGLDRDKVFRVQTPQVFDADLIKGALTHAVSHRLPITDDCSAMELMGVKTFVVEGEEQNLKLTNPADLSLAEALLREKEGKL